GWGPGVGVRVELGETIVRAAGSAGRPEQEIVHGGEEEIGDRLAGRRRRGDGPDLRIVGGGERERLVERRRASALALSESTERRSQAFQRALRRSARPRSARRPWR